MSKLGLTLNQISEYVDGARIIGDSGFVCRSVAPLDSATANDLSFVRDGKARRLVAQSGAGALVVDERIEGVEAHQIVVPDVMAAMIRVLDYVGTVKRKHEVGIHPRAVVAEDAVIGTDVVIGAGAVVEAGAVVGDRTMIYANAYIGLRSRVGDESIVHPNVTIMEDVTIGDRVIVHSGAAIGCDGYGFVPFEGRQVKVPQVGEVVIGDDVEIGACTTIDRGTISGTEIGRGTKIGDLVHIAHNVRIGEDVLLLPTVAISGSTKVGDRAIFAGRAACAGHLTIGEGAMLGAGTTVFKDVEPGAVLWGSPARNKTTEMRVQSALTKLPEMMKEIREIRRALSDDK